MSSGLSRRDFLGLGAATAVVATGVSVPYILGAGGSSSTGNLLASKRPFPRQFFAELLQPQVLAPSSVTAATDYYDLVQKPGTARIFPGVETDIWGYGGTFPGPTVVSHRGRGVVVRHENRLSVPTVAHLHGGRTPTASDGYPIDFLMPSAAQHHGGHVSMGGNESVGSRDYSYPLDQRASTLWYHDHRMDFTGPSVWRGMAGFHVHRDDVEDALPLPRGNRELLIMITDRSFDENGQLLYPSRDVTMQQPGVLGDFHAGVLGDVVLVNGVPWPVARVSGARYRLRILNASNARRYRLSLDPAPGTDAAFLQIGSDGGLLARPQLLDAIELAPAERFDVVVDFARFAPGTVVTVANEFGTGSTSAVMRFIVGDREDDASGVPDVLSDVPALTEEGAVVTRTMRFRSGDVRGMAGWTVNGHAFDPNRTEATVRLGTTEVWRLISDFHHPVHLHLSPFQVLSRGIGGPGLFDSGWKDTIDLRPAEEAAIVIPFDGYPGKYVFHCHNLEHEDMAMMANFTTI